MDTKETLLSSGKVGIALARLELFLEDSNQELLQQLEANAAVHLPQLSRQMRQSPGKIKRQLDQLKAAGFVYSPKRFPKGYARNSIKCVKIGLSATALVQGDKL
ncbi:MAG: hypothetical protein AAGJ82_02725 [Bacteroidota bacterium]